MTRSNTVLCAAGFAVFAVPMLAAAVVIGLAALVRNGILEVLARLEIRRSAP